MKRVFLLFMAFLVCLACFNSMVGANNRRYSDSVDAVVDVVNRVGVASTVALKLLTFNLATSDILPRDYKRNYQIAHLEYSTNGHSVSCLSNLEQYHINRYYSDVKIYYNQLGSIQFNNQFESKALGWLSSNLRKPHPEVVEDVYNKAVESGYPMDNPWVGSYTDHYDSYEYSCSCEVK